MIPFEEQFKELTRGVVDLYVEDEFKTKLKKSVEENKPLIVKAGFDPTAPDLHLGHTVLLNKMRQFQKMGHQVIFLIGDFTGLIGDPTGKSKTRPALTKEEILKNAETYKEQVFKLLDPEKTEVRFNSEWMEKLSSADMIKLAANYNVARMMERDDFRKRYKEGKSIAVHEFLYPLVQAYDSVALEADVELGGHDQIFNLLVGRDIQKAYGQTPQVVLTVPLLEGTDGINKMSKSLNNYIGIDEKASDIYGKTMSISDDMMWKYLELCSDKTNAQIAEIKREVADGKNPMEVKKELASEFVTMFKGKNQLEEASKSFKKPKMEAEDRTFVIDSDTIWLPKLLVLLNFVKSNGEGRRMIKQGAVKIDGEPIKDLNQEVERGFSGLIRCGKRRYANVTLK